MASAHNIMGWILKGTRDPIKTSGITSPQVLRVIHDYGVRLGQHLHLYVPDPPLEDDTAVYDMLEVLLATSVVAGGPYFEDADRVHRWVRTLKPQLFKHNPALFRAYRLDERRLNRLIETLDVR